MEIILLKLQFYGLLLLLIIQLIFLILLSRNSSLMRTVNSFKTHFFIFCFLYFALKVVQLFPLGGEFTFDLFGLIAFKDIQFGLFIDFLYLWIAIALTLIVLGNAYEAKLFETIKVKYLEGKTK